MFHVPDHEARAAGPHAGRADRHRHHHPHHGGPRGFHDGPHSHGRRGRGRVPRGDVRTAVLLLLSEEPMHGYQLMQAIADRTGGRWTPSPGAIYPTLSQLEDEGFVAVTAESGRKLATLTDTGREHVETNREAWTDPFAGYDATGPGGDLRRLMMQLHDAARQVARAGSDDQRAAAAKILSEARRALYLLLADGPQPADNEPGSSD